MEGVGVKKSALPSDCLVFDVNGETFEVPEIDPSTTLLEFLRTRTRFKSVKLGCGEAVSCGPIISLCYVQHGIMGSYGSFFRL